MEYYTYLITFTGEFQFNEAFIRKIQDFHQQLLEDRPVKRELLYEIAPEFYTYTLLQKDSPIPLEQLYQNLGLTDEEKEKVLVQEKNNEKSLLTHGYSENKPYPLTPPKTPTQDDHRYRVKDFSVWDREDPRVQDILTHPHYSPYEMHRRTSYIWEQTKLTYLKSAETILALEEKLGSVGSVFSYLKLKGSGRTPEENEILNGIEYIKRLMKEQNDFKKEVYNFHTKNVILPFPMPEWLQIQFMDSMKDMLENRTIEDLPSAIGIPDNSEKMRKEKEIREQKARDAMILDERDRQKAISLIQNKGDEILVRRELNAKDEALIRKVNLLSDSIKIDKPPEFVQDHSTPYNPEALRFENLQDRQKMMEIEELHVENLRKLLYLNNAKPEEFDLKFWAENLNINTQRLKNIFYHVSALATDDKKILGKLSFVEVEKKPEIFDEFQETVKRDQRKGKLG
jgi:uncharacterized protein YqcC (DUF446 family)